MADSPLSTDPFERYGAIERAYCEERWSAVIHDAQALIVDLERAAEASPEGLKERLELLIAHSFLYGLGDRDSAEDLYHAVLRSGAEASLRQIAEQGLQQCALPVAPPESQEQEQQLDQDGFPSGSPSSLDDGPSAWSETAALASSAESTPWQGLQDSWAAEPASPPFEEASLPPDEVSALSWLTAEPKTAPQAQDSAALPVMPWLETDAAAATAAVPGVLPEQAIHAEDLPIWQDEPLEPVPAALPPQDDQASTTPVAAVAEIGVVSAAHSLDVPPVSADVPETALVSPMASTADERLVADVVEEPELIELYQPDGSGLEELLAQPVADASTLSAVPERGTQVSPPVEPERSAGIERRGSDRVPGEVLDRRMEPEPPEEEEPAPLPASPAVPVASGVRPFSAPPEPVAEEDPELLMGLLKVEMG